MKLLYFNTTIFAVFVMLVSVYFAFDNYDTVQKNRTAIIFATKAEIKNAPTNSSEEIFELHEGTKVVILDELDNWKKIKIADGKTGWVYQDKLKEIYSEKELGKFKTALLLGIAYASSIGGMATLIGTPTNLVFKKIYENFFINGIKINFANWMIFAFPIYVILIVSAFLVLYFFYKPKKKLEIIDNTFFKIENLKLGKTPYEQKIVLFVFLLFALLMIFRADIVIGSFNIPGWSSLFNHSSYIIDAVVAAFISILLFIIPSKNVVGGTIMDWNTASKIPWGIILLFGGGFALEKGFEVSGLTYWMASKIGLLTGNEMLVIILTTCFIAILMTQFIANVTVAQALLPLCVALSISLKINPLFLMIPITFGASAAFLLPISTPPNAILFATGQIKMKEMVLPGLILIVISGIVISFVMNYWGTYVFGISNLLNQPKH